MRKEEKEEGEKEKKRGFQPEAFFPFFFSRWQEKESEEEEALLHFLERQINQ